MERSTGKRKLKLCVGEPTQCGAKQFIEGKALVQTLLLGVGGVRGSRRKGRELPFVTRADLTCRVSSVCEEDRM